MDRLQYFFATILILLAPVAWRLGDYFNIVYPSHALFGTGIGFLCIFFLWAPLKRIKPGLPKPTFLFPLFIAVTAYLTGPLSDKTTLRPELSHCGALSFTGVLYHLHPWATEAFRNDLEAKNQMCWLRKMIDQVPSSVDTHYFELMAQKLQRPEIKFRSSLPLIAFLHGKLFMKLEGTPLSQLQDANNFLKSLKYWESLYAYEISGRDYSWYEWPYSALVNMEYGLIEGNWKNLVIEVKNQ